jgi:hypothetical protein
VLPILVREVPVDLIFAGLPYEEEAIARAKTIQLKSVPFASARPRI